MELLRHSEKNRFQLRAAPSGAILVLAIIGDTRFPKWSMKKKAGGGGSEPKPDAAAARPGAGKRRTPPDEQTEAFPFSPPTPNGMPDPPPPLTSPAPPQVRLERRPPAAGPPLLG